MNHTEFERLMKLQVMFSDSDGITRNSLTNAAVWNKYLTPTGLYLFYQDDPWDFLVYVVNATGSAIRYSGFAWGYSGEGPRGLQQMIKELGWTVPDETAWPQAHVAGVWFVAPNGKITRPIFKEGV